MFDGMTTKDYRDLTDSKYYILKECGNAILLIFVGWPYDEDYSYLTIVAMNASTTRSVYHKQAELVDIIDTENGFKIVYRPNDDKERVCHFTSDLTQEQNHYAGLFKLAGTILFDSESSPTIGMGE